MTSYTIKYPYREPLLRVSYRSRSDKADIIREVESKCSTLATIISKTPFDKHCTEIVIDHDTWVHWMYKHANVGEKIVSSRVERFAVWKVWMDMHLDESDIAARPVWKRLYCTYPRETMEDTFADPICLALIKALEEPPFTHPNVTPHVKTLIHDLRSWNSLDVTLQRASSNQKRQSLIAFLKSKTPDIQIWRFAILQALVSWAPEELETMRDGEEKWMREKFINTYNIPKSDWQALNL